MLVRVKRFTYEVILDNIAAQEVDILKVFGNWTVSPEVGKLNVYIYITFFGKLIIQLSDRVK